MYAFGCYSVDIHSCDYDNHIYKYHPPLHPPWVGDVDHKHSFLTAHCSVGVHCLHMQCIFAACQVLECHSVLQWVAVAPHLVETFHPIHKLQSLTLVVVSGRELYRKRVLTVCQFQSVALVECLRQSYLSVVFMSGLYLCFTYKQLCQHHSWQGVGVILASGAYPVNTIQTAEHHVAVALAEYRSCIKLIALQSVRQVVVIQAITEHVAHMVALHHHAAHSVACGEPDVLVFVFGDTAYTVVAKSVVLGDVVKTVVLEVEHVHTVACSYPQESS